MTDDLCVLVPSRGRPENCTRLAQAWISTGATADLHVIVDDDDPMLGAYQEDVDGYLGIVELTVGPRVRLGPTLNREAVARVDRYPMLGFLGDDNVPLTAGWDERWRQELRLLGSGFVYGNDLFQGATLPTAVGLTSDIVAVLGYMCPPDLVHMYLDNAWLAWGQAMDRITYLPDVLIEHVHPHAGKAVNTGTYDEAWQRMGPDGERFGEYYESWQFVRDVRKLRTLVDERSFADAEALP